MLVLSIAQLPANADWYPDGVSYGEGEGEGGGEQIVLWFSTGSDFYGLWGVVLRESRNRLEPVRVQRRQE